MKTTIPETADSVATIQRVAFSRKCPLRFLSPAPPFVMEREEKTVRNKQLVTDYQKVRLFHRHHYKTKKKTPSPNLSLALYGNKRDFLRRKITYLVIRIPEKES